MANIKKVEKKETGLVIFQDGDDQKKHDFFVTGDSVDEILKQIEKQALEHVPDLSTNKGRNAIKANVTMIGDYKTFLETTGKDLSAEYKSIPGKIDGTRKKVKEFLADLKERARQKLTDWEVEQKVIEAKQLEVEAAEKLQAEVDADHELAIEQYKNHLREVADQKIADELAAKELAEKVEKYRIEREENLKREAAEEATRKAEKIASDAKIKSEQIKQDAINAKLKAEQDTRDANARENLLVEQAKQRKIDQEVEDKRLAGIAEQKRLQVLKDAKHAQLMAKNLAYLNDAHEDLRAFDAEVKRLADIEQSRLDEIQRQKDAQAKIDAETLKREQNKSHRRKINQAILKVFASDGISDKDGRKIITLLVNKLLPNCSINY